jgi:predicted PurR-regulated permease PerM
MTAAKPPYTFDRVARLVVTVGTAAAGLLLLRYLADVLIPFVAAVIIAYLLNPLVTLFERKTAHRGAAVAITLGGITVVGAALLVLMVPLLITQVSRFSEDLRSLHEAVATSLLDATSETESPTPPDSSPPDSSPPDSSPPADDAPSGAPSSPAESRDGDPAGESPSKRTALGFTELMEGWRVFRANEPGLAGSQRFELLLDPVRGTLLGVVLDKAVAYLGSEEFDAFLLDLAGQVAKSGWSIVAFAVNSLLGLTVLVLILLYVVFLLLDFPAYVASWKSFLPPEQAGGILEFLVEFEKAMRRYFRGQFVVASCVGVLSVIGFSIIGLPLAVPMGLLIGALNMVPYLQIVGMIPTLLLAVLGAVQAGSSITLAIFAVLAVFAVVQVIQDAVLVPKIMGKATGLRPVAIMLGIFIWGKLLGFLGLLLAIPLTCLGIAYYRRLVLRQRATAG